MDKSEIHSRICEGLPGAEVGVQGDDGAHFQVRVVFAGFSGKRTLERHKMVYETLGEAVGREIHALSLRTLTPDEASSSGAGA